LKEEITMKLFRLDTILMIVLLCLATGMVLAQDEGGPAQVGLGPDAPTYALHGPYWVGTQTFTIDDALDPVAIRVWYPALNPDGALEAITYTMHWDKFVFDGFDSSETSAIAGHALVDAQPDTGSAPYPLVVFSHGFGVESVFMAWFAEHLASYGFVVMAPDHEEIADPTFSDFARSAIVRPQTISRSLDYAAMLTASTGALAGVIDMERVAVAGQSYGGYTALAVAGARFDMSAYKDRCAALTPSDPNQFSCSLASSEEDMAGFAGLDAVPQGLWPSMGDPRVDAIITISGASYLFDQRGLAEITVPVLAMGGTRDTVAPYDWGIRPTYDYISSQQKILASFENADHFIASTSCADAPEIVTDGFLGSTMCSDAVWDMNHAHDLMNHFATAFLLDVLNGDTAAAAALAPDAVDFSGISYEAEGF
jgi:predicted dienelactone hydrolase